MHAGAEIDQPIRPFDQRRQDIGCQHIDREDARNSRLGLDTPRLPIADAHIVDYGIEAAELVDLVGDGPCPGNGRKVPGDDSQGAGSRRERVAAPTGIASVQDDLMALLDQEPGRQEAQAVR
jgi:hypothetical protein